MKPATIKLLQDQGYGRDAIYEFAAGEIGLFGVAFFGHKGKRGDRSKLERIWKYINKVLAG